MHGGIESQLLQRPCSCFQIEGPLVGDHRILGYTQSERDFLYRGTLRQQFENLPFPIGKIPSGPFRDAIWYPMVASPGQTVQFSRDHPHALGQ